MSIRALAIELYRVQQCVDTLKKKLAETASGQENQLEQELMKAERELFQLKRQMEGRKENASKGPVF